MTMLIQLESNFAKTILTLVDGTTTTGYKVLRDGMSLGNAGEKPMFSRTIDSLGVRVTGAVLEAREQQYRILIEASSTTILESYLDALVTICREITHQGGGKLRYRSGTGTYTNNFKVSSAMVAGLGDIAEYDSHVRTVVTLAIVVDPYGLSAPLDIVDDFSADSLGTAGIYNRGGADYTADAGALTNGVVRAHDDVVDASANLTTQNRWIHTGTPHVYADHAVSMKHVTGASVANYEAGVILKRKDSSNYLSCYITAATNTIRIDKTVAGTTTNLANTAATPAVNTTYWIVGRIENHTLFVEHWATRPTPTGTPTASTSVVLTADEMTVFGRLITGRAGILWTPIGTAAYIDDFKVEACKYKNWLFPDVLPLNGAWGGTAEARLGVYFTNQAGGTAPIWMMYAWYPTPPVHNMVWNGGAESIGTSATAAYGWVATAVSGVISAATSVTRTTTAASIRTGAAALEVITPATTDTGASFAIYRRFKKGVTYVARCYVRAAAGTTAVRCKLGVSGDLTTGATLALSTTYEQRTVKWTPTADVDVAYFAVGVSAATATTFQVDDVVVYEQPSLVGQYSSATAFRPLGYWRLGESSGNFADSSGGAYTLTATGNPTYAHAGPIQGDTTTCVDFDGTGDYGTIVNTAAFQTALWSSEAWFKRDTDTGAIETIFQNSGTSGTTGFRFHVSAADVLAAVVGTGGAATTTTGTSTLSTGVWYHAAVTYDGTSVRLYLNGSLEAITAQAYTVNSTQPTRIGAYYDATVAFSGKIANVALYDRCLTALEIEKRALGGPPDFESGGYGPGIIAAADYDKAAASTRGTEWTLTTDADYRAGFSPQGSGAITTDTGELEFFLLPHLFVPDDFSGTQVDVAVFARVELASTQTSLTCAISIAPEGGTSYGARKYSEFRSTGKVLKLPSSSTVFKPYYLGTVTLNVDRANPIRWKLRLAFSNGGGATGTTGVDYLVVVPARTFACSRTGASDAQVPDFISSTSQTTKLVRYDLSALTFDPAGVVSDKGFPDDGLGRSRMLIDKNSSNLLVWPSDQVIDLTDSSASTQAEGFTGTVQASIEPQHHLLRQA